MFVEEIGRLEATEREDVMEIMTSWAEREAKTLILRLLNRRVGTVPASIGSQIDRLSLTQLEALGEALLDFSSLSDLEVWLTEQRR